MSTSTEMFDYARYLADKKSIDDDSLNATVQAQLLDWLASREPAQTLHCLELGAGIGTQLERLLEKLLERDQPTRASDPLHWVYTAVEQDPRFQAIARQRLQTWSWTHGFDFMADQQDRWRMESPRALIEVTWRCEDILDTANMLPKQSQDLLLAHAVLDLLPLPHCLPTLLGLLNDRGAYYFSLNYAGQTRFAPAHPHDNDIEAAYHDDMDSRFDDRLNESGWQASRTGLLLGPLLCEQGHEVSAEGASDWQLQAAEASVANQFMGAILDTIEEALAGHALLPEWLALRRRQLADGELVFRAANRDYFGFSNGRNDKPYIDTRDR